MSHPASPWLTGCELKRPSEDVHRPLEVPLDAEAPSDPPHRVHLRVGWVYLRIVGHAAAFRVSPRLSQNSLPVPFRRATRSRTTRRKPGVFHRIPARLKSDWARYLQAPRHYRRPLRLLPPFFLVPNTAPVVPPHKQAGAGEALRRPSSRASSSSISRERCLDRPLDLQGVPKKRCVRRQSGAPLPSPIRGVLGRSSLLVPGPSRSQASPRANRGQYPPPLRPWRSPGRDLLHAHEDGKPGSPSWLPGLHATRHGRNRRSNAEVEKHLRYSSVSCGCLGRSRRRICRSRQL